MNSFATSITVKSHDLSVEPADGGIWGAVVFQACNALYTIEVEGHEARLLKHQEVTHLGPAGPTIASTRMRPIIDPQGRPHSFAVPLCHSGKPQDVVIHALGQHLAGHFSPMAPHTTEAMDATFRHLAKMLAAGWQRRVCIQVVCENRDLGTQPSGFAQCERRAPNGRGEMLLPVAGATPLVQAVITHYLPSGYQMSIEDDIIMPQSRTLYYEEDAHSAHDMAAAVNHVYKTLTATTEKTTLRRIMALAQSFKP